MKPSFAYVSSSPPPRRSSTIASALAGFASLNYNLTARDQLRLAASLRKDHYQVPNTPEDQEAGPQHLPHHTSVDFAIGKPIGENIQLTFSILNAADNRFLFGRDSSCAGTHYNDSRQFIGSVRYWFHF